jgi:hypothetical protein
MNLAGEIEVLGGNLPRSPFVHHKIPNKVFYFQSDRNKSNIKDFLGPKVFKNCRYSFNVWSLE